MSSMMKMQAKLQSGGEPPRLRERARHLALLLVVMFLPATTLYSQVVGSGTTLFGIIYVLVTIVALHFGRVLDDSVGLPPVHTPAWEPPTLSGETPEAS